MTTDPYAPPAGPGHPTGARLDWAAAAVYAGSAFALSYAPHTVLAELSAFCDPSALPPLGWIAPAAAAATGLAAGAFAAAGYGYGRTGLARLALGFVATWAAATVGFAAGQLFIAIAWGRPAAVLGALFGGGVVGAVVSPAGLVPWGILELVRRR
jgi:hypothetical protein